MALDKTFINSEEKSENILETIKEKEEKEAQKQLAENLNLPFVNLALVPIKREALLVVPKKDSLEAQLVVFGEKGTKLNIGLVSPKNASVQNILKGLDAKGYSYKLFVVTESAIKKILARYPIVKTRGPKIQGGVSINQEIVADIVKGVQTIDDLKKNVEQHAKATTSEIWEVLFAGALVFNASDIHVEPEEGSSKIRYRIDGILNDITFVSHNIHDLLLSRIKLLAHLLLNVHDISQDGRFTIMSGKEEVEIRVSIVPAEYKESVTLRILNPKLLLSINELGFRKELENMVMEKLRLPYGMILVTGPTGSGKTTTLYAFIEYIKNPKIKIITIEDPIEYRVDGISQTQVNPEKGYDFPRALRAILRQDPDVILVGEMRDAETVSTSLHAALTGHLVFSTLHTNDAAGAIPRLVDMKAKPSLVSPSLDLIIAQRLVRKLCKYCKKEGALSYEESKKLRAYFKNAPQKIKREVGEIKKGSRVWEPSGCDKCLGGGYSGRIGIFEILIVDEEIERMILSSPSISDLRRKAREKGMVGMMQDGILKVLNGVTSLEEIRRVTR